MPSLIPLSHHEASLVRNQSHYVSVTSLPNPSQQITTNALRTLATNEMLPPSDPVTTKAQESTGQSSTIQNVMHGGGVVANKTPTAEHHSDYINPSDFYKCEFTDCEFLDNPGSLAPHHNSIVGTSESAKNGWKAYKQFFRCIIADESTFYKCRFATTRKVNDENVELSNNRPEMPTVKAAAVDTTSANNSSLPRPSLQDYNAQPAAPAVNRFLTDQFIGKIRTPPTADKSSARAHPYSKY
jgi:hypothetical protein